MIPVVFTFLTGAISEEGEYWLIIICYNEKDRGTFSFKRDRGTFSPKKDIGFVTDSAGRYKKALVGP